MSAEKFSSQKAHAAIILNQFNSQMGWVTCGPDERNLAGANIGTNDRENVITV